jgi:vesicle-fusing ATPase
MLLNLIKNPGGNTFAFGNLAAVNLRDFSGSEQGVLLDVVIDRQVFTIPARAVDRCAPGQIGLTEFQRRWLQIGLGPGAAIEVYPFSDPIGTSDRNAVPFAGKMEVEITWARPNNTTDQEFPLEELTMEFLRVHENQIIASGQSLGVSFRGLPAIVIRVVQIWPLAFKSEAPIRVPRAVITGNTEVAVAKSVPRLAGPVGGSRQVNPILSSNFNFEELGIGGLENEFSVIFRKAFASRLLAPTLAKKMGLQHCRGMLLFGPPGTGKTLIARQISKVLNTRPPKIINGPEVLNKYVGQSEENIRKVFEDAEKEYKEKGDASGLHVIIFDELDAVCKQRGSGAGGNTGVGDTIVNQLLTKLDGVEPLNNILLIGMTNRKDMIDEALLRPGRLEIHIEVSLPDEVGRVQILQIHTAKLRESDRMAPDVDLNDIAKHTKNFSGAEIAGLIRAAISFAITRVTGGVTGGPTKAVENISKLESVVVTEKDFQDALAETTPMFGVANDFLGNSLNFGIIHYNERVNKILAAGKDVARGFGSKQPLVSTLLYGPNGAGKTALAAQIALDSDAPFVQKVVSDDFIGMSELQRVQAIDRVLRDADRVSQSQTAD